jgi:tRNA(Ile)-lysidine synthase TilS/MesJ
MRICKNCVLPETFPGITFDKKGICNYCRDFKGKNYVKKSKKGYQKKFEQLLKEKKDSDFYDCLMAYSGGKDSTYTLHLLKRKFKLNVLALTFDHGFASDAALRNVRKISESLGIDLLIFKPRLDVLKKIFKEGAKKDFYPPKTLQRASTICTSCMGIVKFYCLRLALEKKIPFIIYGWSPGQIPLPSSIFKNNPLLIKSMQRIIKEPLERVAGKEIDQYFLEAGHFQKQREFPYNISPLAFSEYDEDKIKKIIKKLGWKKPQDTDPNSSNCLLNSLANFVHKKRLGFNPYAFELAKLVREGHLDRKKASKRLAQPENMKVVNWVKKKLDLTKL